jgi:N-acetylneuraminate synthase
MSKCFVIAEIGINHSGSVDLAKKLISAAHFAGADAVKFQKRDIDTVYTKAFLDSPRESPWGSTQRAQKEGLEFGVDEYDEIDAFCHDLGVPWFASAWDLHSLDFLKPYNCKYNKVASAMLTHAEFIEAVAMERKPTFISTGMATETMVKEVIKVFTREQCPFTLMHTISVYPCPPRELRLQYLEWLKRYNQPIGYSGHEVGLSPTLAAVALGAVAVERHITLDRSMYGSDQSASVEPFGFKRMVDAIREIEEAMEGGYGPRQIWDIEKIVASKLRYWEEV